MRLQIVLIVILAILALGLTVGQRFGFEWAGGEGYNPNLVLSVVDSVGDTQVDRFRRGQMISTGTGERLVLATNKVVTIALDERTDVELISTRADEVELYVHRGRILVESNTLVKIRSDWVRSEFVDGEVSFVYYDFNNTASIIPFDTKVNYSIAERTGSTTEPIDIMELAPYSITPFEFEPVTSSAANFYDWAL
jgi:hypothetical protein